MTSKYKVSTFVAALAFGIASVIFPIVQMPATAQATSGDGSLVATRVGNSITVEWDLDSTFEEVTLTRDGVPVLASADSSGVFTEVISGEIEPTYEIVATKPSVESTEIHENLPVLPNNEPSHESVAILGLVAPTSSGAFESVAEATPAASSTTLRYLTFIPNAYVAAPSIGCEYSGDYDYYFKGDNRTYSATSGANRTKFDVTVNWSSSSLTSIRAVGATRVYQYSNGAYIFKTSATASNSSMKLTPISATSTQSKFNIKQDVSNPYCSSNGIYFDLDVTINKAGSFAISGERLQVPSHEIYIKDSDTVLWKTILRDPSYNFTGCLIPGVSTAILCLENYSTSGTRS